MLIPLTADHAEALHALIAANRAHLTEHGDYRDLVAASVEALRRELDDTDTGNRRFGICREGQLVGRIDLIAVDPPRYGLGYWLAQEATGQGLASAALAAVIAFARDQLGATDLYAGVTHGNARSETLLRRAGFAITERFAQYSRFHRPLGAP